MRLARSAGRDSDLAMKDSGLAGEMVTISVVRLRVGVLVFWTDCGCLWEQSTGS